MSPAPHTIFTRYIGIDYSGAQTPTASLPGLRVYMAVRDAGPVEVRPSQGPKKHWTRRGIAEWLVERLAKDEPAIIGIDHGFSFPIKYFVQHRLPHDWPAFLDDFHRHWPTDEDNTYVEFVRDGTAGDGVARAGDAKWRRVITGGGPGNPGRATVAAVWPAIGDAAVGAEESGSCPLGRALAH